MTRATRKRRTALLGLALAALSGLLLIAPLLIRGLAAHSWVVHYAALEELPRPRKAAARAVAQKASVAMWCLAPLPQASEAARLALDLGQRAQQGADGRETALVIFQGVRQGAAEVRGRPFAGPGFAVIEARAAALEEAARSEPAK